MILAAMNTKPEKGTYVFLRRILEKIGNYQQQRPHDEGRSLVRSPQVKERSTKSLQSGQ